MTKWRQVSQAKALVGQLVTDEWLRYYKLLENNPQVPNLPYKCGTTGNVYVLPQTPGGIKGTI